MEIFSLKKSYRFRQPIFLVVIIKKQMLNLDATEEKFNPEIFHKIVNKSVEPVIDLFASRIIRNTDHDTQNQVLCQ